MGPTSAQNPKQVHIYMELLTCPSLPAAPCDAVHYAYDPEHPAVKKKSLKVNFFFHDYSRQLHVDKHTRHRTVTAE